MSRTDPPPDQPLLASIPDAHAMTADDVLAALRTDARAGLSEAEAAGRLDSHGPNELRERPPTHPLSILIDQFRSPVIVVLLVAAIVTALISEPLDTIVILAIVVLNAAIGFAQEYRAEKAMAALQRLTTPHARVVRDGADRVVAATTLVPGDIVRLEAGDVVSADLRLLEVRGLRVNESSLTGESEAAEKTSEPLPEVGGTLVAEQRDMAFSGTFVTYGRGVGVVVTTGMATALGRVAALLQERPAGPTPLQKRLGALGARLATVAGIVCAVVFVAGLVRGESPETMLLAAISLAVAAIPEGLPAIVTVALAVGAHRMAARHALVRKLPAVETLGSVTFVCSDKTGTLTESRMVAERVWTPRREYVVEGSGYAPSGRIEPAPDDDDDLAATALVAAACNDATLVAPDHAGSGWGIVGDPTEAALLAFAEKAGVSTADLRSHRPRVAEVTFDPARRLMTTVHRTGAGAWVAVKGALEAVVPRLAPGQELVLDAAVAAAHDLATAGYRVLALADREMATMPEDPELAETSLRLRGLVGMADPPRAAAAGAVAACRRAGVTAVMITGDHPGTAHAIASRLGLAGPESLALTGPELERLDDAAFAAIVRDVRVYARTNPEQKLRIVEALQAGGEVVAMTGDGVNDAPALRRADIGVAMGIAGTEVSKEAADMILADDDFSTIVAAVEEGRRIYDNIRRFVRYLLTTNSAEIWVMLIAPFLGLPLPLVAIQILWINLVTDGLPAIALGLEAAEPDAMTRPPRRPSESILAGGLWQQALWVGLLMAVVTLAVQGVALAAGAPWQTMTFMLLALLQLGNALAVRSEHASAFSLGLASNRPLAVVIVLTAIVQVAMVYVPFTAAVFDLQPLDAAQLALVIAVSPTAFVAVELGKWVDRRRMRRSAPGTHGPVRVA
jgi:P-type Ca2+ transporter type 2C